MTEATTTAIDPNPNPNPRRVCFSFAAYAKSVISHLRSVGIPVAPGLSGLEFSAVESAHTIHFPPDLRSLLREGLPLSPGFPNWRSSSDHHLHLLLSFPISSVLSHLGHLSANINFRPHSFGPTPAATDECAVKARGLLVAAPALIPICYNYYIPSSSSVNGNPVFFVKGGVIKRYALDITDFFRKFFKTRGKDDEILVTPAWAARTAREVEVWTQLAGDVEGSGSDTWGEMGEMLREGGWREEEVREMMMTTTEDGCCCGDEMTGRDRTAARGPESVAWHLRLLGLALLRAGWRTEDVAYCMGPTEGSRIRRLQVTWRVDNEDETFMEVGEKSAGGAR